MRIFARVFGLACGAVIIAIAGRYGYKTSDNEFDGYIWAFTYGSVTLGGLFGHSLAVHAWRQNRGAGALVFAASVLALIISLSNSIAAMAGRGNEQQAERVKIADTVRDTRRSLKLTEEERERLRFTPTDGEAVRAARTRATAATQAREAECGRLRGSTCRNREAAESQALADVETAARNKALTDHAARLDAEIAEFKAKIERAGPVLETNAQGSALARLFGLPDAEAATVSTYQNLAMALVIEFLIAISLVASEVIENGEKTLASAATSSRMAARNDVPEGAEKSPIIEAVAVEREPVAFPASTKPRLIASRPDPIASVATILADIMVPGCGKAEIADVYAAYGDACAAKGKRPIPANEFPAALAALCQKLRIEIEDSGTGVFLRGVKINKANKAALT